MQKDKTMQHMSLAEKITAVRKSKGLSQEQLAEDASINLRTLQRIENGETEPRGHTLRLLAKALDRPIEDFLNFTKEEDKGYLQLMNLSALAFWILPLGNIFIPLVLWVMKKDSIKGAGELGRRIINFQITWSFLTFTLFFLYILFIFLNKTSWWLFLIAFIGMYIINSIIIIISSIQINRGNENVYWYGIKIIR